MIEPYDNILAYLRKLDEKLDQVIGEVRQLNERTAAPRADQASSTNRGTPNVLLDAKGLNCPVPVLKASKIIKEVPVGGTLEVLATDPGSIPDFQSFCRQTGHELVESGRKGDVYRLVIKRQPAAASV